MRDRLTLMQAVALIRKTAKAYRCSYHQLKPLTRHGLLLPDGSKLHGPFREAGVVQYVRVTYP